MLSALHVVCCAHGTSISGSGRQTQWRTHTGAANKGSDMMCQLPLRLAGHNPYSRLCAEAAFVRSCIPDAVLGRQDLTGTALLTQLLTVQAWV
jgi:hypothetical protein